jgi:hypothetical protein
MQATADRRNVVIFSRWRWLAVVVAAALAAQPAVALGAAGDPPDDGRARIAERLVELGRPAGDARQAAARLTAQDLEVLLAHPDMMQAAGGVGLEMSIGVVLVVGLIVGLAIAGSTVIIVSV